MIEIHNLKVSKGGKNILKGVSFEVEKGEVVVLLGENGAGKTTVIRAITGLEDYLGEIYIDGYIPGKGGEEKISVLSQNFDPFGELRVKDIISVISSYRYSVVNMLGISEMMEKRIRELSGGEKQRVGVAFALMQKKEYILLDEPTSNMDISYSSQLAKLIKLERDAGKGILIATHDLIFAHEVGDRFVFMKEGKVVYITSEEGFFFACTDVFGSNPYLEALKSQTD